MKKIRNTKAKVEILTLLQTSLKALSGTEIQNFLGDTCDRATVYRVLDRLINEGLVHKVIDIDRVVKYAKCKNCKKAHQHNHLHFSCEKCHTLTCLEGVQASFELPEGYQISDINFTVIGICPACNSE
ncbi:Fur family transcriptional regulator [Apibacter sp. HY039]|uniref:Fur family transcriptional regulator n=1 Tax=Apibacter sp. HY039 TaxID=2501476 RepID=UPI000FEB61F5|nr:transcriptional repressor [Apibacter sp. HY039]